MGMPGGTELIIIFMIIAIYAVPIVMHYRQDRVVLEHDTLNTIKEVPFLFSWTSVVFGFWVPLLRGVFTPEYSVSNAGVHPVSSLSSRYSSDIVA